MRNKNETEPDVDYESKWKKDCDQNVDYPKMDSDANTATHGKKDSDQQVDNPQMAPNQEMHLGQGPSQPKVDSDVPSQSTFFINHLFCEILSQFMEGFSRNVLPKCLY